MRGGRILQYAEAQARIRARLAALPTINHWKQIADASDLDNLIERMRSAGLSHWLMSLPRAPDAVTVERALFDALTDLVASIGRMLPRRWQGVRRWMEIGIGVRSVADLLSPQQLEIPAGLDATLRPIAKLPRDQRLAALQTTRFHSYVDRDEPPLECWLREFENRCPALRGTERYMIHRITASIRRHHAQIREWRERIQHGEQTAQPAVQWRLRGDLELELRNLLSGDPFHAGLILIYGLLELIQYERCRALLIASTQGWPIYGLLRGLG